MFAGGLSANDGNLSDSCRQMTAKMEVGTNKFMKDNELQN
jgi:hypothetical protein